jgi:hypothetical protein
MADAEGKASALPTIGSFVGRHRCRTLRHCRQVTAAGSVVLWQPGFLFQHRVAAWQASR